MDAFSLIRDDRPFAFLNTDRSAERQRFDAAHELGHLLLHAGAPRARAGPGGGGKPAAAAFLMPRRAVLAQGLREATLDRVLAAKRHWTVSAMAMTHRLHELRLLSDWNYRTTWWRWPATATAALRPGGAWPEVSQVAAKVLASLRERGGVGQLAEHLGLGLDELSRHLFRLVPTAVAGGADDPHAAARPARPRP